MTLEVGVQSLNQWTARDVPLIAFIPWLPPSPSKLPHPILSRSVSQDPDTNSG